VGDPPRPRRVTQFGWVNEELVKLTENLALARVSGMLPSTVVGRVQSDGDSQRQRLRHADLPKTRFRID